jgi:hypothetical protein
MQAGVWNARVLLRELREQGYTGGYTLLTDWLRPQRQAAHTVAVRLKLQIAQRLTAWTQ